MVFKTSEWRLAPFITLDMHAAYLLNPKKMVLAREHEQTSPGPHVLHQYKLMQNEKKFSKQYSEKYLPVELRQTAQMEWNY